MKTSTDILCFFKSELNAFYSDNEIESLAYWCIDYLYNCSRSEWLMNTAFSLSQSDINRLNDILFRLKKHEPIQYILGVCSFFGLDFKVNPSCLIPRPETEELIRWILQDDFKSGIDLGTGSGCIAISLAKHSTIQMTALDISSSALDLAKLNAEANNVEVKFIHHDIFEGISFENRFDFIVSNPPYVLESEKPHISTNVLDYEPELALFVKDDDPLKYYKRIVEFSHTHLKDGGVLFFEINEQKAPEIEDLLEKNSFCNILIKKDMQGKNRMVKAVRKL